MHITVNHWKNGLSSEYILDSGWDSATYSNCGPEPLDLELDQPVGVEVTSPRSLQTP